MRGRAKLATVWALALAALVGGALSAPAAVRVGQSGWSWGNPLPQGSTLQAIEFAGARGYASGEFGTLLRTDDAGATWRGLAAGTTASLPLLQVLDADTLVVGGGCTLRRTTDGGATFARLPFSASESRCPAALKTFAFATPTVGYLVLGDGTVLRTADAGQTFARRTAVPGTPATGGAAAASDVAFVGPDTGVAVTAGGTIYRTTDGAGSWTQVFDRNNGLSQVTFVDATTGYVTGPAKTLPPPAGGTIPRTENTLLRTVDGGLTWAVRPLTGVSGALNLGPIHCAGALTCLITTAEGDRIVRTANGGETAASITASTQRLAAAAFASATRAIAVGQDGATAASSDGGVTYAAVGGSLSVTLDRLRAGRGGIAYAVGRDGALARTTDGGASWTTGSVSTSENVQDVAFPTSSTAYALDTSGAVLRSDNAGASWRTLNTGTAASPRAVLALSKDTVLLLGPIGMRRTTDGGATEFAAVRDRLARRARLVDGEVAGGTAFAWGSTALLASSDRGRTWAKLRRPSRGAIAAVDFVSSRVGLLLDVRGRLWSTRDRARTWSEVLGIGTNDAFALAFSDRRHGYLATRSFGPDRAGFVLRTSDAGKTWRPQLVSPQPVRSIAAGGTADHILVGSASLFSTTTGGDAGRRSTLTLTPSAKRLGKPGVVKFSGRLRPNRGDEQVVIALRSVGTGTWTRLPVKAAANGTFSIARKLKRTTYAVAQWAGDGARAGDGSAVVAVKVG